MTAIAANSRLAELPLREPYVLQPLGHPVRQAQPARPPSDATRGIVPELDRVAEATHRLGFCLGLAHSTRAQVLDAHREMRVHLVVHVAQHAIAVSRKAEQTSNAPRTLR